MTQGILLASVSHPTPELGESHLMKLIAISGSTFRESVNSAHFGVVLVYEQPLPRGQLVFK